jgi:glycosyltransferase involved in cell wall biosynthesis
MGAKISCLMLTHNRRRFVSQAIWYFLRQDYPWRELVIVDADAEPVADLVPNDSRIRYVRPPQPLSVGARLNFAAELASGELLAHWDDDAWYGPRRLSAQATQLESADVAALHGLLHYQPLTGRVWCHDARPGSTLGLHGAALAYRRAYWNTHRFAEDRGKEVAAFVRGVPAARLDVRNGSALVAILLHGSSTGPVNAMDPRWQPRPFHELARLVDLDLGFYSGLRANGRAAAARSGLDPITLAATFMAYDGYGSMAEYLALGMKRAGADVHIAPFRIDPAALSPEFHELWRGSRPNPDGIVLCHAWWGENLARFGSAQSLFVKTAWETSRLPEDWPARLNKTAAVIVPSHFAARVFRESGVSVPVEVAHEGVDPDVYPYLHRRNRSALTTLVVGVLAPRKNYREAVAAWKLAFADDHDARLILKARFQLEQYVPDDPRIRLVDTNEPTRGILHWYQQADVLLALGNEGFGLPLIEGMATGLPVVALDAEAQSDVCQEAAGMVLPVRPARWEKADGAPFGSCGVRAIPDVEDAARQLRWVADNRREAREMGRRASAWVHAKRNVWDLGPTSLEAIERHARSPRPLRRTYAVWAPASAGLPEVRYYSQDLVRSASLARLYDAPPGAWRSQSLHVQHAPDLFDNAALARQVQAARHGGMSVVVTEHLVNGRAEAWEQCADVLIALSAPAAERLRARWPRKRVEHIPPGCPPWRAATRKGTGRVVAIVGLPLSEDGARELVDAMATVPRARLLVFGSRPEGRAAGLWTEAARRLRVRFEPLPPSSEELARRLNEEADAVVFWDHEGCYLAASHTARIALASGAPVLTSPTSQYADLAAATFQPEDLGAGLREVLESRTRSAELAGAARAFCEEASWPRIAALHLVLWRTLSPQAGGS